MKIISYIAKSLPLFIGVSVYIITNWYWTNVCADTGCDIFFMNAYLAPLREAGLVLAGVSLLFIFLPFRYFKSWIMYLFPLMFLVTLALISNIDPNSGNMFNATREEAMRDFFFQWVVATLVFVLYCWQKKRREEKVSSGKYLLVALGAILISFVCELIRVLIGMQFGIWW